MKCYSIVIADNVQNHRPENDNNWYTIIKNNNGNIIMNNLFAYYTKKLSFKKVYTGEENIKGYPTSLSH